MKTVKEKRFFIKLNDVHSLEIIVSDKGDFSVLLHGRNINKSGISGDKSKVRFRIDFQNNNIILIKNDDREEPVRAEAAFAYYFKLIEFQEAQKKVALIDGGTLSAGTKTAMLDEMWEAMEDVTFDEDDQHVDNLVLSSDFFIWDKGTPRLEIWHWFDNRFPDGIKSKLYHVK